MCISQHSILLVKKIPNSMDNCSQAVCIRNERGSNSNCEKSPKQVAFIQKDARQQDLSGSEDVHLGPKITQQKEAILINLNKEYVAHLMVLLYIYIYIYTIGIAA